MLMFVGAQSLQSLGILKISDYFENYDWLMIFCHIANNIICLK